jgi:cytochrome c oxidase cbb3-type subunit 3
MRAVAHFVVEEFVQRRDANTRYHTAENGWPDHDRFRSAFRFVRDPSALALPAEQLSEQDAQGKRLYLSACISCHDAATVADSAVWDARPVSYPLDGHDCVSCHDRVRYPERGRPVVAAPASYHGAAQLPPHPAAVPSADPQSPYAAHDTPVALVEATPEERRGEALYARNCAFCHAADGTARHWIGRFLEPHPRDLTDPAFRASMSRARLRQRIEDGLPGTAMPTWKNALQRDEIAAIAANIERAFGPLGSAGR